VCTSRLIVNDWIVRCDNCVISCIRSLHSSTCIGLLSRIGKRTMRRRWS
jgi:hypothetical protein